QAFAGGEERAPGSNPVIVLSYPYWRGQLNGDREVIGKALEVNGTSLTVIGVAPEDFIGTGNPPEVPDFWAPLEMQTQLEPQNDWLHEPSNQPLQIVGRLAPATSIDQAQAETEVLIRRFEQDHVEKDQTAKAEFPFPLALDRCSSPEPACQRFAAADSMVRAASHFAALIAFAFPAAPRSQALLADYPSR